MLRVEYVEGGGLAESRGISAGQELLSVNGVQVSDVNDVYDLIKKVKPGSLVMFGFRFFCGDQGHMYGYRERAVPLTNLEWIELENKSISPAAPRLAEVN